MSIRDEAERVVRELGIDRKRFHEVSKPAYADISSDRLSKRCLKIQTRMNLSIGSLKLTFPS